MSNSKKYVDIFNKYSLTTIFLSLYFLGSTFTASVLLYIGMYKEFNKWLFGLILYLYTYSFYGFKGIIIFKLGCLYTLYNVFSNIDTDKKLVQLKKKKEFLQIEDKITNYEKFKDDSKDYYKNIKKKYVIKSTDNTLNHLFMNYPETIEFIENSINIFYNIMTKIFDDIYLIHRNLYDHNYDIYVYLTDFCYSLYTLYKLIKILLSANSLLSSFGIGEQKSPEDMLKNFEGLFQNMLGDIPPDALNNFSTFPQFGNLSN